MTTRKVIGCKRLDGGADCLVISGCSKCANAIYEQEVPPRGLRTLIAALQAELEKNGDAEHVAIGICLVHERVTKRIDIHGQITVLSDWANYPNGEVVLTPDSNFVIAEYDHDVAVLIKAALDAAVELDWVKKHPAFSETRRDAASLIRDRVFSAIEQLQPIHVETCSTCGNPFCEGECSVKAETPASEVPA